MQAVDLGMADVAVAAVVDVADVALVLVCAFETPGTS